MKKRSMDNLPLETTKVILSGLPLIPELQCRGVCTTWRALLPKPKMGLLFDVLSPKEGEVEAEFYFSEQTNDEVVSTDLVDDNHKQLRCLGALTKLNHSIIMPKAPVFKDIEHKTFMVGSCNGLVCYAGYTRSASCERSVYICNPLTGEQIPAPASKWERSYSYTERSIGFGYNHSSNEYKVVRILQDNCSREYKHRTIHVCTLQGGPYVWRNDNRISEKPLFSQLTIIPLVGVFACGALHWIDQCSGKPKIVAFDLEHETLELLPTIPYAGRVSLFDTKAVMELGGNLCVLEVVREKRITLWEFSKYTDKQPDSYWLKKFNIAWEDYSWFGKFARTKGYDSDYLLWYNAVLSCYDPETKTLGNLDGTLKEFMDDATPSVYTTTRATPYVNSVVSLKAFTESRVGKKRRAP